MNKNIFFYSLSFLEGASVMAAELLGAKMLAPYFGTSLNVWSAVLAVTLGGLAMGYFVGGVFSEKKNTERNLYYILLASAAFLIVMPTMAKEVMIHTTGFSLLISIVVSSFFFLFPPVIFMGMVSPMIVGQISNLSNSGKAAGTVYGISTLGGILSTFLFGFYFIPNFGLTKSAIGMGIILVVIPFAKLIASKKFFSLIFLPISIGSAFLSLKNSYVNLDIKILYSSEGLLGQIIVVDYPDSERILFVNRSTQTIIKNEKGKKGFCEYVNMISERTHNSSIATHALVLGLGGGTVANELVKNGFQVDAVELDERMADVAKKYFDLNEKVNVTIDDARHFVRSQVLGKKYQVIVLDAFIGESNPHHLFTTEFFSEAKSLLSDTGIFFINGNGFWNGDAGKGMRSVCKTLINSGFDVEVVPTDENEDYRNLVFIAKQNKGTKVEGRVSGEKISDQNLQDAIVLVDDKPQLEILNAEANKRWREACMKNFMSGYYSGNDKLLFK